MDFDYKKKAFEGFEDWLDIEKRSKSELTE